MFSCQEGSVVRMRQKSGGYKHLTIILNNPTPDYEVVVVNVTGYEDGKDGTCKLLKDDHPWLYYEKSYITYGDAQIANGELIEEYVNNYGSIESRFEDSIFIEILCCAMESDNTPDDVDEFLRNYVDYDEVCIE
jgi:hypothetical protein